MKGRRGAVLITALLILAVIFVLGVGLLYRRLEQYRAAMSASQAAQARALALAGLEQVRVKLDKDPLFPLPGAIDQSRFAFSETVVDASEQPVGSFTVELDSSRAGPPYYVLVVVSTGVVASGDPSSPILARRILRQELDVAPDLTAGVRGAAEPPQYTNPGYWEVISLTDLGGY